MPTTDDPTGTPVPAATPAHTMPGEPPPPDPPAADPTQGLTRPGGLLAEYAAMGAAVLTDAERWPSLGPADLARVEAARTHPAAPPWVHATGDRLDAADLAALAARAPTPPAPADEVPAWVPALVERVHRTVPRYRAAARSRTSGPRTPLVDLPTVSRADLVADAAAHVPVDVPLDRVLEGSSSGSTGAALVVPLHPRAVGADLLLLHALVTAAGATWDPDPERLGLLNLVDQRTAFTYVSAMSAFPRPPGAPVPLMARANLHADAWRRPGDRERWLAAHDPQVVSTSTHPLLHLLRLAADGLDLHPVAVVNGATHVTPAVRADVHAAWGVPLVDLYGLRETGPVAADLDGEGHVVVDRRVHVEILDAAGRPVPDGTRGEIVVTVDENPYLPLLRYRTGDHASLRRDARGTVLLGLEGRTPVQLLDAAGRWRPSIDATQILQAAGLRAWSLHQHADARLTLRAVGPAASATRAAREVEAWLGHPVALTVEPDPAALGPGKPRRFTSEADPSAG